MSTEMRSSGALTPSSSHMSRESSELAGTLDNDSIIELLTGLEKNEKWMRSFVLTVQISKIVVRSGLDWKDSPSTVKDFIVELQSLKGFLSETTTNLTLSPDSRAAFQDQKSALHTPSWGMIHRALILEMYILSSIAISPHDFPSWLHHTGGLSM